MSRADPVAPRPAASVALLRSAPEGIEILYLRRNPALRFHGGYWVFPGGRIDDSDAARDTPGDEESAARVAAAREEAGMRVDPSAFQYAIHWTTPEALPIRFATWFFVAEAPPDGVVTVDGGEILDHRWLRPAEALALQARGEMPLGSPTFALTTRLSSFARVDEALGQVRRWPRERLLGRLVDVEGGRVALYAPDPAYEAAGRVDHADLDLAAAGPRHRLWMLDTGWRYERSV